MFVRLSFCAQHTTAAARGPFHHAWDLQPPYVMLLSPRLSPGPIAGSSAFEPLCAPVILRLAALMPPIWQGWLGKAAGCLPACLAFSSFCIPSYSACLCGEGLPHAAISSGIVAFFRFVLHSDPRFSPLESLGPCPLLSRRAGWRGPFFLFVFGASSLLVCFFWLVVQT